MGPFRRSAATRDKTSAAVPADRPAQAASCEYRHFGDDSALLIIAVRVDPAALPGQARLQLPSGEQAQAAAISFLPAAGLARIVFAVERSVASAPGALEMTLVPGPRVLVPEPVKRPAVGVADGERDHAVAAALAGDELAGLVDVLERRCGVAERVARDLRETRSDATKLAQAYREIWEVRELLESREEAYRKNADALAAAVAAQGELEAQLAEARTRLEIAELEQRLERMKRAAPSGQADE